MQESIRNYGYTLILDEVLEVVQPVSISKADQKILENTGMIEVGEDNVVRWKDREYKGEFNHLKRMANSKTLIRMEERAYLWIMPVKTLTAFSEMFVLTFMFDGSHMKHYLDLYSMKYRIYHVSDGILCEGKQPLEAKKQRIRGLMQIYEGTYNAVGDHRNALSKSWWKNANKNGHVKVMRNNTYSFFRYECEAKSHDCMWSVFSERKAACAPNGYAKGFCACNARATNEYREKQNLAYLVNVYDHPYVVKWFSQQGIQTDEDAFALSQLVQWVWRSAIRDGKRIMLYLPSKRMRNLLVNWLENKEGGK